MICKRAYNHLQKNSHLNGKWKNIYFIRNENISLKDRYNEEEKNFEKSK